MSGPKTIAGLGGTFDHFHVGHHQFLKFAAAQADQLWVGLTEPELNQRKLWPENIQSYDQRAEKLEAELRQIAPNFRIFPLSDGFGPTLLESPVTNLVVTDHSVAGGDAINRRRKELGLSALPVAVCPLLKDGAGQIISSTRIRSGELNREGQAWFTPADVSLSRQLRNFFSQPLGELVEAVLPTASLTVVVGDVCTDFFLRHKHAFDLAVVDGHSQRKPYLSEYLSDPEVLTGLSHPAGSLNRDFLLWLRTFFDQSIKSTIVKIDGEEDLVAAEAVLTAPLGSAVYYGQPGQGMIAVQVTEQKKKLIADVVKKLAP